MAGVWPLCFNDTNISMLDTILAIDKTTLCFAPYDLAEFIHVPVMSDFFLGR